MTIDVHTGIEWLDREACLELMAGEEVGRLVIVDGRTPSVFPVNFALDGENVVFRTDEGTKLSVGPRSPSCFEVDLFDRATKTGWSVVATGRLEELTSYDAEALERARQLPVWPWASGEKAHWMRLVPARITGRRIGPSE